MRISDWSSDVCSSDLALTTTGAEVRDGGLARLSEDAHVERGQRLEERPEEGAVSPDETWSLTSQKRLRVDTDEPRRESGIRELVLRRGRETPAVVGAARPGGYGLEDPYAFADVAVRDRGARKGTPLHYLHACPTLLSSTD